MYHCFGVGSGGRCDDMVGGVVRKVALFMLWTPPTPHTIMTIGSNYELSYTVSDHKDCHIKFSNWS